MATDDDPRPPPLLGTIDAVLIGRVRHLPADGTGSPVDRPWHTAIHKAPVRMPVPLGETGAEGDEHADTLRHGGPDKAVLLFSHSHYDEIASAFGLDLVPGAFGENLLVSGIEESTVCIGDLWRAGSAELRITQPRQPAWKIARRWHRSRLPKALAARNATGWYARVERTGAAWAGAELELLERPSPSWPVSRTVEILYARERDPQAAAELARSPRLAASWKAKLATRYRLSCTVP